MMQTGYKPVPVRKLTRKGDHNGLPTRKDRKFIDSRCVYEEEKGILESDEQAGRAKKPRRSGAITTTYR